MAGNLTVESCGAIFANSSNKASSNYGIGSDGRIALYVDEANRSWCTSSSSNDNRAITIEVANSIAADPWPVSDEAYASLINLLVDICQRNGIKKLLWQGDKSLIGQVDKQNMTVHRWFAQKACPGDWLYNRHGQIAAEVNKRLNGEGDEEMTQETFNQMLETYLAQQAKKDSTWELSAMEWAQQNGLVQGDENGRLSPKKFLTRGEMMTVLQRFKDKFCK
jgi:N-acetyl-anhydromuramyl-L-alanine amidase AmpD